MKVAYEWDRETVDQYGDIIDHSHSDTLEPIAEDGGRLVLVRDEYTEADGVQDRLWAYVDDAGKLPEFFSRAGTGEDDWVTSVRVPQRFHKELARVLPA